MQNTIYMHKYLKYKSKYLQFKKQQLQLHLGGTIPEKIQRRLEKEIEQLKQLFGTIIEHSFDYKQIIVTTPKNNFILDIPDNYPFVKPVVTLNGAVLTTLEWTAATKLINIVSSYEKYDKYNVIVFCHPKLIKKNDDHFLYPFFEKMIAKDGHNINTTWLQTIDILPGGSTQADGFNPDFIKKHQNEYDIVFVPDCGGLWFEYQKDKEVQKIFDLTDNLLRLIKPGGKLYLSKFLYPEIQQSAIDNFKGKLIQHQYEYAKNKYSNANFVEIIKI